MSRCAPLEIAPLKATTHSALVLRSPLQVLTHKPVRPGTPLGERLLNPLDANAKLFIGNSVAAPYHERIQALLSRCGRLHAQERPDIREVLREVVTVLRCLNGNSAGAGVTITPLPPAANDRAPIATTPAPASGAGIGKAPLAFSGTRHAPAATASTPAPPRAGASKDRDALMALYSATNGLLGKILGLVKAGGWKKRKGWGTSRPLGEWHGVTVDGGGRVGQLDLRDNNLKGG